ncbi:coiled-coil domain-containing protein 50 isoform X2 [Paramormyrops kingsleyae]|uniref:coiled-coil domain-containing protein 50 isoform X2 n=1 Tax=Paramormyrops kingsleyae TaxID=1676925 RepID=UPI000CD6025F|nr:coiled-coil domain-containing protein 50 isoform X2 [Paramormyrops kingsleyae]
MADYIDQNSLPGVKEVCRDFALLEDHSLAQSLQDQEIESHLASNVHRSRLMQQDLRVARRLQQEENLRASIRRQQVHKAVECRDSEMAMEIQEELVKQERQNRHLEEKDEAFARKLQEKEMKEQRRRKKQKEPMIEEEYYEDQASWDGHGSGQFGSTLRQPSLDAEAVWQKEKPSRPPPPQWDRGKEAGRVAHLELPPNKDPLMMWDMDEGAVPSRAYGEWEGPSVSHSRQTQRQPSRYQQSNPVQGGRGDLWEPQLDLALSGPTSPEARFPNLPPRDPDRNEQAHYDIMEVTQGLDDLDVQEVRDMEVARRIQEEELMASRADKQAAQVAQDEEIAWLIMEEEEEKYKKCKNRDKRLSKKDRKLQQEDWTPLLQEESEHLKSQKQRPERPPAPVLNCDYVESISYPRPTFSSQAPARPQSRPSFKVELPQEALISKDLR